MKNSNHALFATKVWIFSGVVTPLLASLFFSAIGSIDIGIFGFAIMYAIPIGLVLSLPCYLILLLFSGKINKSQLSYFEKKAFINCFALAITYSFFFLINYLLELRMSDELIPFTLAYGSTLTLAIWIFKLKLFDKEIDKNLILKNRLFLEDILDDEKY